MATAAKTKQTAAERRAEQSARAGAANAAFEAQRSSHWTDLWARALRLCILIRENPRFEEDHGWFSDEFRVNAQAQSFRVDHNSETTEASLTRERYEKLNSSLEMGESLMNQMLEEQERRRLAEIERQRLEKQAIAKLTDEELAALGISARRR